MNSSASSSEVLVLLHQVDESGDGLGLEVDVAVKSEQVRVLGFHLFDENKLWIQKVSGKGKKQLQKILVLRVLNGFSSHHK